MPAMEAIKGFKYKRHAKALKTSEFSYADVVTPGAKAPRASKKRVSKKTHIAERRQTVQSIDNPRHDPNAKTRPSKRRPAAAASSDVVDKKKTRHSKKNQKKKHSKKQKEEKLVAPMYPTDVISGTSIRERVNASAEGDKLYALFQEVLRSETSILAKNFTGKFQFVMNAVKGVSREFLQTLQEENSSQKESNNIAKNSRNVALAEKKANLQGILASLQKEERDWVAAKERIQREAQEETQSPVERPIATSSSAEVDSVQDVMVQSVQHISVQLDTLQKSLVASRFLSDSTMESKDKLSEHFASYTQQQNGSTDSPRKIIKNLLRGPMPILA